MSKNRVKCTVTGLWFNANQNRMRSLLQEYGSPERLEKEYVSRLGKSLLKQGKSREEIKALVDAGTIVSKAGEPVTRNGKRGRKPKTAVSETERSTSDKEVASFMSGGEGKAI